VERKWDCKQAPVEGGCRGIQVQREEQVGYGLHNVSTWIEKNTELEHNKKEENRMQEQSNKRKLSTWAEKNRTQEQSSKRNFST